jgi:predicted acyl esterase
LLPVRRAVPAVATAGLLVASALATGTAGPASAASTAAAAAPLPFTTTTLHFRTTVGPANDVVCDVVGDLRVPQGVDRAHPAPAILTTNGFGGSKDSTGPGGNGSYAARFAEQGYVTLSYSGLGFGGSGCNIYIDDPAYDGKAGSQLVSFLGGARGIATRDGAAYDIAGLVERDATAHDGTARANDPRVGMIGGSYGGQVQYAVAGLDPRVDTLLPIYTWNDLGYSLAPNNGGPRTGVSTATAGIWKAGWHSVFTGLGVAGPLTDQQNPATTCGGYTPWVCRSFVELVTQGYPSEQSRARQRQVSVASYLPKITIPVLLSQGQKDSLFNLNEAAATYQGLRAQGTPVRMLWQSWGHTVSTPVAGENDNGTLAPGSGHFLQTYQGKVFSDWFAHWLRDVPNDLGPAVRYFRDYAYVPPAAGATPAAQLAAATAAYGTSTRYPVGTQVRALLSGGSRLVPAGAQVAAGSASFVATSSVVPTSSGEAITGAAAPPLDAPGTVATWTTSALTRPLDVAGVPTLQVRFSAPTIAATQTAGPAGRLMLFAKLYDVDAAGNKVLVRDLVSAVRVPDVTVPVSITLPGVVHRFAAGHQLQLALAASDVAYKGTGLAGPVTVVDSPAAPNSLTLPVIAGVIPR